MEEFDPTPLRLHPWFKCSIRGVAGAPSIGTDFLGLFWRAVVGGLRSDTECWGSNRSGHGYTARKSSAIKNISIIGTRFKGDAPRRAALMKASGYVQHQRNEPPPTIPVLPGLAKYKKCL